VTFYPEPGDDRFSAYPQTHGNERDRTPLQRGDETRPVPVTRGLNAEGLCSMHSGTTDLRELGKRSGEARRKPNPDRVHEGLRSYLQREVSPSEVWAALKLAMEGQNESARVGASKVLMDALSEPRDGCPKCAEREREAPNVAEEAERKLGGLVVTCIRAILTGDLETAPGFARVAADQLDDDLQARIAELR
jgi:hypothetical protein